MPQLPSGQSAVTDPVMIYQVRTAEQLTEELADTRPDYIYIPVKVMHDNFDLVRMFKRARRRSGRRFAARYNRQRDKRHIRHAAKPV